MRCTSSYRFSLRYLTAGFIYTLDNWQGQFVNFLMYRLNPKIMKYIDAEKKTYMCLMVFYSYDLNINNRVLC